MVWWLERVERQPAFRLLPAEQSPLCPGSTGMGQSALLHKLSGQPSDPGNCVACPHQFGVLTAVEPFGKGAHCSRLCQPATPAPQAEAGYPENRHWAHKYIYIYIYYVYMFTHTYTYSVAQWRLFVPLFWGRVPLESQPTKQGCPFSFFPMATGHLKVYLFTHTYTYSVAQWRPFFLFWGKGSPLKPTN